MERNWFKIKPFPCPNCGLWLYFAYLRCPKCNTLLEPEKHVDSKVKIEVKEN